MNLKPHTLSVFDREINELRTLVLTMGREVEAQVQRAVEGVRTGNTDLLEAVRSKEKEINAEDREVFEKTVQLIVRNAPTASDLRLALATMQIATDLERVGDEAKKIAKAGLRLLERQPSFTPSVELDLITRTGVEMLHAALDLYARLEDDQASEILARDKEVDRMFKGILRELITYMMEDPRTISQSIELVFIAKALERVGDHAKNIVEHVIYVVEGKDVRYRGSPPPQAEA
ncbi:phosphate signaling complex protein PhoU [Hydrogenophilus thermoluteolus]|jgi:phosphate transport system protein|nr:phosphate signaling complex protein PhoU [Hydrogenophilus thermoluteolus]MBW7657648.1 phosphate signaling complex protein PhoU [Hydrogenophilus thermoluteolus]HNQ49712.1 phosphate signaling complex protein PhoU [Hydrogenophilus thermoluteolus]HNU18780.1 phosphate signaling complex protein PhoU [Hydrogenophilus thermoluteolus]